MVDRAKAKAMNLDQVHKKIDSCLKNRDRWLKEYKNRLELVKKSKVSKQSDYWNVPYVKDAYKKAAKYEKDLDEWDRIRGEKVEEEVEVEEAEEQSEQEEAELEEAVAPTNYHIPWKEAGLNYDNIRTSGWGTKEQRVKRMTVEQVEIKIQGQQLVIDSILGEKARMTRSKQPLGWFENNKFWSKRWKEAVREKAEWEQIKAIKLGAKEDSIEDYDEEEEQEKLNEILGQSYSERWGDRPSDTGDTSPQSISVISDGEEAIEEEMTEEFGDDEPEKAYEDTRQTVKKADNMLFSINTRLDNLRKIAGRVREMVSEETDLRWLKHTATTIKRGISELERQSRQITKGSDKAPESIYEVKSRLEKIIRKGVRKMEKRRKLIEKKDIYDSFGLLKQFTSYNVNTIGTGSLTSRSSGLQFTIKKFR